MRRTSIRHSGLSISNSKYWKPSLRAVWQLMVYFCLMAPLTIEAQTVVATIPAGTHPQGIAANRVTNKIYVINQNSNVVVIDGATNTTQTLAVGTADSVPVALAVNSVTNKIYVVNQASDGTVSVIDGTQAVLRSTRGPIPFMSAIMDPMGLGTLYP